MQTSPIVGPSKFGCVNSPSVRLETRISPRGSGSWAKARPGITTTTTRQTTANLNISEPLLPVLTDRPASRYVNQWKTHCGHKPPFGKGLSSQDAKAVNQDFWSCPSTF